MTGALPVKKTLADLGCHYTVQADSLSLVGEETHNPMLCMKVGRAAILFKLTVPTIASLRVALSKL